MRTGGKSTTSGTFLALDGGLAVQAQHQMAARGLVPLLVGQLLGGAADGLEPALRIGSLRLLQLLAAGNPKRVAAGNGVGQMLRVVVTCLADCRASVRNLGMQILQELAYSRQVGLFACVCMNMFMCACVSLRMCVYMHAHWGEKGERGRWLMGVHTHVLCSVLEKWMRIFG